MEDRHLYDTMSISREDRNASSSRHKYETSCYHDQVSNISSYRCKSRRRKRDEKEESGSISFADLWSNVIALKGSEMRQEIQSSILLCKQSLAKSNEKLSLTLDQVDPCLKVVVRLVDFHYKRTLLLSWIRYKSRLNEIIIDTQNAIVLLQSKWRRVMAKKEFASTMLTIVKIQCLFRKRIAMRHVHGLKKERRREALLVRERLVKAYVARCQTRKREEKQRMHMYLVRDKALKIHVARYRRRKLLELEHKSAITCQAAVRGFFAKRQLQSA